MGTVLARELMDAKWERKQQHDWILRDTLKLIKSERKKSGDLKLSSRRSIKAVNLT